MTKTSRVVVTGIGIVSSIGIGIDKFWKNLVVGKSGISKVSSFDTTNFRTHKAGEVKNFNARRFMEKPEKKGRSTQLLLAAMKLAIKDADLLASNLKSSETGTIIGITSAEPKNFEKIAQIIVDKGAASVPPFLIASGSINSLSPVIGCELGLRGFNMIISTACSAANCAIGYGHDLLKQGRAKIMFCGGAESLSRIAFTGFNRLFAVTPDKCRPFDKNRQGMILGEGSCILALETLEGALARKANIYAEVLGYGLSCDARDMTIPSREGIKKVMERAIKNSCIKKSDVDYINAHGTGTRNNDRVEAHAIRECFGRRGRSVPVSSIKSIIGHTIECAGAMEGASCCMTIKENIIPPTINFQTPDPECDINIVANKARRKKVEIAINNSFGFGGNNACVVFGRLKNKLGKND